MPSSLPQKKFLVQECAPIVEYLQQNAHSTKIFKYRDKVATLYDFKDKIYILQKYKKPLDGLKILVFVAEKKATLDANFSALLDITSDKRYSKKYLTLFGNPSRYDFTVDDVFKKCDSIGLARLDLHFLPGMSRIKVFRTLLYRLHQIFLERYNIFVAENRDFQALQDSHQKLYNILSISKQIFDKKTIKLLVRDMKDLYLILNHADKMQRYCLNFKIFIAENSSFYDAGDANEPIYFFVKKYLKKALSQAQNTLEEKNRYDRAYIQAMDTIKYLLLYFESVLSKKERLAFQTQAQILKKM